MFKQLIQIVTFDVLEALTIVQLDLSEYLEESEPFSDNFEALGYSNSNTAVNMGFANFLLAAQVVVIFLFVVRCPIIRRKHSAESVSSHCVRLILELFFDVSLICVL